MPLVKGDHSLRLEGGRRLGFAVYGDPEGMPVVSCHGGLVSGHDVEPADEAARSLGLCVISPDRPGIGRTDRMPGYDMLRWVQTDLMALLDRLGIDRFGVMGWSEGGQYALAAAYQLPERVAGCVVIAGCVPLDQPAKLRESNWLDFVLAIMARKTPRTLSACFTCARLMSRGAPTPLLWLSVLGLPKAEVRAVTQRGRWFPTLIGEGAAQPRGVVDEYLAAVAPWRFLPEEVSVPVHLFQGAIDTTVPEAWARELADRIPDAQLTMYPDEGHFIGLTRRREALEWLARILG